MSDEKPTPQSSLPRPRRGALVGRVLVHASLLAVFATVGGALLVWPQWVAVEGSRSALHIQEDREHELEERFEALHAMSDRLREWNSEERKTFFQDELDRYPQHARAIAAREGAKALGVKVGGAASPRWQALAGAAGLWADTGETPAGEIRPVAVKLSLSGPFDAVYRTVVALGQEDRLLIPDRWQLEPRPGGAPAAREVRAELTATVFVIREAGESPAPPAASAAMAAASPLEVE